MSFTNQALGTLGSLAAVSTMSQSVSNQNKANELKKAELGVQLKNEQEAVYQAGQALNANSLEVSKEMVKDLDPEVAGNSELNEDTYLELKQKQAEEVAKAAATDFSNRKLAYEMGAQKSKPSSKRLDMANKAFMEAKDAVEARRQLKYDLEMAKKKVAITRQALEGVK